MLDRWDRSPDLAGYGVSFLLYGLLDVVVDGYFERVQAFDEYYDEVSEGIFAERPLEPSQQRHWFQMRQALVRFHRLVVPMREAVSGLMRREHSAVAEELYPYFQDVYDHVLRVSESTEALRDLVSTIVETNLSLRDYRQNQIVKKVTQLGRDHRRADADHRLLRHERALPGLRRDLGRRGRRSCSWSSGRRALRRVPAQGLALSGWWRCPTAAGRGGPGPPTAHPAGGRRVAV